MFHGGGFCIGDIRDEERNCRNFTERYRCVCVDVDYRLAPENPFPAAVNDAWDALKWVAKHHSALGSDLTKGFIVAGTSAGGNLAAVLSLIARDEGLSPALTGTCLLVPGLVSSSEALPEKYRPIFQSRVQNHDAPVLSGGMLNRMMDCYRPDHSGWHFNVLNHPKGQSGLPPVFLQVCGMDPLRDDGLLYESALREQYGVKTRLEVYPGLPHMFHSFFPQMKVSQKFVEDTANGVGWLLQK